MLRTFKQTIESVKNLDYGPQILKLSLRQVIWYWFKYVLFIGILIFGLGISAVVYFTPQIPKFISEKAAEQPFVWKEGGMEIYLDQEKFVATSPDGVVNEIKTSSILNNQGKILGLGIIVVLFIVLSIGIAGIIRQLFQVVLGALGFWILGLVLKKRLKYSNAIKIVIFASVVPLLLSIFNLTFISMVVWAFYSGAWIYRLPTPPLHFKS